jgi:hypothetical protein
LLNLRRIIIIAVYRLLSLRDFRATSDALLDRVFVVVWTQGELTYSLVTATIPSLVPFLARLNTGLGALSRDDFIKQTQQDSSGSFALQSLKHGASQSLSQNKDQVSATERCSG